MSSIPFQTGPNRFERERIAEQAKQDAEKQEFELRQRELQERRAAAAVRGPQPDPSAVATLKTEQVRLEDQIKAVERKQAEVVFEDQRAKVSNSSSVDEMTEAQRKHEEARSRYEALETEKRKLQRTLEGNSAEIARFRDLYESALFEQDRLIKRLAENRPEADHDEARKELASVFLVLGRIENSEERFKEAEKIRADLRERDPYWYAPDYIYQNRDGSLCLEAGLKDGARTFLGKGSRIEKSEAARLGLRDLFKEAK